MDSYCTNRANVNKEQYGPLQEFAIPMITRHSRTGRIKGLGNLHEC